jgi:hypothetical protein
VPVAGCGSAPADALDPWYAATCRSYAARAGVASDWDADLDAAAVSRTRERLAADGRPATGVVLLLAACAPSESANPGKPPR